MGTRQSLTVTFDAQTATLDWGDVKHTYRLGQLTPHFVINQFADLANQIFPTSDLVDPVHRSVELFTSWKEHAIDVKWHGGAFHIYTHGQHDTSHKTFPEVEIRVNSILAGREAAVSQYENDLETLLDDRECTLTFEGTDYIIKDKNGAVVANRFNLVDAISAAIERTAP